MMDTTDIPTSKASRDERNSACLHFVVMEAIEAYFDHHGERSPSGQPIINVVDVASKLAECTVEIINSMPDRSKRRRAMRFAHDALDANMKSQNRGKLVAVDIPAEH